MFLNLLTTREQAVIIWTAIFLIFALLQENLRKAIFGVLKVFFQRKIFIPFSAMLLYIALVVHLLSQIQLWNVFLLKETIFWVFGTALVLFMNLNKASEDGYFRRIISDNLKVVLVLMFLINFYTFSLFVELILLLLLVFTVAISTYAGIKKEYQSVKKAANFILSAWGVFVAIFVFKGVLYSYQNLLTADNLLAFSLPLILTFALLPFLYFFAVFMTYETLFIRIEAMIGRRDKQLADSTKRKILKTFTLNLKKLNRFSNESSGKLSGIRSEQELKDIIEKSK